MVLNIKEKEWFVNKNRPQDLGLCPPHTFERQPGTSLWLSLNISWYLRLLEQLLFALNAGSSHSVKLDVPAHPNESSIRLRIASAINIFKPLLIAADLLLAYRPLKAFKLRITVMTDPFVFRQPLPLLLHSGSRS
jgi:hypothetical protein